MEIQPFAILPAMESETAFSPKATEEEIKLPISDLPSMLKKIRAVAKYVRTGYIRDIIYGKENDSKKIRLRIEDNFEYVSIDATHKYKVAVEEGVKKEVEETIYKGSSFDEALGMVALQGDFKEENSYEKTRILFKDVNNTDITIDIYPFGAWLEIEGTVTNIHRIADGLGFSKKEYMDAGADELYLTWIKKFNLPEMWDVRFGLSGKR